MLIVCVCAPKIDDDQSYQVGLERLVSHNVNVDVKPLISCGLSMCWFMVLLGEAVD
jgi:hypothetical protein